MEYLRIGEVAKALGVSVDTLRRWEASGRITFQRHNNQRVFPATALPALTATVHRSSGKSSTRNRLPGVITSIVKDKVMAQVEMACGDFRVVSLISTEAVNDLGLEIGDLVTAVIKSTNVSVES